MIFSSLTIWSEIFLQVICLKSFYTRSNWEDPQTNNLFLVVEPLERGGGLTLWTNKNKLFSWKEKIIDEKNIRIEQYGLGGGGVPGP